MTEAEWLGCNAWRELARWLGNKLGARKSRLLAAGICRLGWPNETDPEFGRYVDLAERFAEGQATETEVGEVWDHIGDWDQAGEGRFIADWEAAMIGILVPLPEFASDAPGQACTYVKGRLADPTLASLIRCVAGNPFRPVIVYPAWLRNRLNCVAGTAAAARAARTRAC